MRSKRCAVQKQGITLNVVLRITYFFKKLPIGLQPTFLKCTVIFCNSIGQLCLSDPVYSRTVNGINMSIRYVPRSVVP